MSQSTIGATDPEVAKSLADYDHARMIEALQDAAAAAARHDGEVPPDPATGHDMAVRRVADWMAVLSRFRRDLDADFDPNDPPEMNIVPPGPDGRQYPPGVDPRNVRDPAMRQAYIEAIDRNREKIRSFGTNLKLFQAHKVIMEKAAESLADARINLGLTAADLARALQQADLRARDRTTLMHLAR